MDRQGHFYSYEKKGIMNTYLNFHLPYMKA